MWQITPDLSTPSLASELDQKQHLHHAGFAFLSIERQTPNMILAARLGLITLTFWSGFFPRSMLVVFAFPSSPRVALDVVQSFDAMIDQRDYEKAALLLADDVVIITPLGKKSNERFLNELRGENRPVWSASETGDHEHQCVSRGTRKLGFLTVNGSNKINKITVTKQ